jgi:hypothetical protein
MLCYFHACRATLSLGPFDEHKNTAIKIIGKEASTDDIIDFKAYRPLW